MLFRLKNLALFAGLFMLTAGGNGAGLRRGRNVKGPMACRKGAVVDFQRQDIKGSYKSPPIRKALRHYGLPSNYNEVLLIDGKEVDHINNLHTHPATADRKLRHEAVAGAEQGSFRVFEIGNSFKGTGTQHVAEQKRAGEG